MVKKIRLRMSFYFFLQNIHAYKSGRYLFFQAIFVYLSLLGAIRLDSTEDKRRSFFFGQLVKERGFLRPLPEVMASVWERKHPNISRTGLSTAVRLFQTPKKPFFF
ncbi:uncharacterized protein EV154DRAFT_478024 [Mucor mucedo]|uniref:uncharacterized protein n=1 Tax=Mucor mucedo TaxID=29922 RepID=UPI00221ED117|nr:uncharacterized protein EV154DRAFT_478024 [Mucor mucedo]KAI7894919.1 hypothetical protein EV154DRAFT_478024 [Mucor mucedo]